MVQTKVRLKHQLGAAGGARDSIAFKLEGLVLRFRIHGSAGGGGRGCLRWVRPAFSRLQWNRGS